MAAAKKTPKKLKTGSKAEEKAEGPKVEKAEESAFQAMLRRQKSKRSK